MTKTTTRALTSAIMALFCAVTLSTSSAFAEEKNNFFVDSVTDGINKRQLFVDRVKTIGVDWAKQVPLTLSTATEGIANEERRSAASEILSNVPKGALKHYQYIGKTNWSYGSFTEWLKTTHNCYNEDNDLVITEDVRFSVWQEKCSQLIEAEIKMAEKAINSSTANDTIVGNASFTLEAAKALFAGDKKLAKTQGREGVLRADDVIALIHLAALMLPFEEWVDAYGLVDDLNLLIGKPACFLPNGKKARCGKITAANAKNGVTIKGNGKSETISWKDILGKGPALGLGKIEVMEKNWGTGSASNEGFTLSATGEVVRVHTHGPGTTATYMKFGVDGEFKFDCAPVTVSAEAGVMTAVKPSSDAHYTERTDKKDMTSAYFELGVGYTPVFNKHVGLTLMPKGIVTTNGGWGAMGEFSVDFLFGKTGRLHLSPTLSAGYMNMNEKHGGNPTTSTPDSNVHGFAWAAGLSFGGTF